MKNQLISTLLVAAFLVGCGSTIPNRIPDGESFPAVRGSSLDGQEYEIPGDFSGKPVILVVAYDQDAQFDIDRWGIGFFTANLDLPPVYEIPTIPGLIPSLFKGRIDSGMRSGILKNHGKT